eukprot:4423385-Alexandrium_andersonii.AAC.1
MLPRWVLRESGLKVGQSDSHSPSDTTGKALKLRRVAGAKSRRGAQRLCMTRRRRKTSARAYDGMAGAREK